MTTELNLTTPALLFSALSLLLLAYTNRFLSYGQLVRSLHESYRKNPHSVLLNQIDNFKLRVRLIRNMQFYGITSLLLCVVTMFLIYVGYSTSAAMVFGVALISLIVSLVISLIEIMISTRALNAHLSDLEKEKNNRTPSKN